jgi:hypothetical protein
MSYTHEFDKPKASVVNTVWPHRNDGDRANNLFREYLKRRRLDFETAYLAGWYMSSMDCDRVVIPCVTTKPDHVYYQARAIDKKMKLRYRSPFGARHGALCTVDTLNIAPSSCVAIVEGPMDALALASHGVDSIAIMGIRPDQETRDHLLKRLDSKKYRVCAVIFDNEDEAKACALRLSLAISTHGIVSSVLSTKSKDCADATDAERNAIVKRLNTWANLPRRSLTNISD